MGAINYLLKRTTINSIKEWKKHPLKLISYLAFIGFLIFAMFSGGKTNNISHGSTETFNAIFLAATLFLIGSAIKSGIENGNSLFRMADVNFLFPSPIKPQKILIYGFIKQIFASFTFVLIVLFQMPNIYMNFPVQNYAGIIIAGNMLILSIFCGILSIFIYAIGSLKEKNKGIIKKILYVLAILLGIGAIYYIVKSQDLIIGISKYLNLPLFKYLPVIGWLLNIFNSGIYGINSMTLIYIMLIVFISGLLMFIIYKLDLDYYEDTLTSTESKEELLTQAKEGKAKYRGKIRKTKYEIKYNGGGAILSRQVLETRKKGLLFLDVSTLIMSAVAFGYAYFSRKGDMIALLYMLTYMNLIFLFSSSWDMELKNHYIFLIPESSSKKVFFASALEILKSFVNGLIIFIISSIIFRESMILGIIMAITYTSFTALILYAGLITRRILSGNGNFLVKRFLRFLITVVFLLPGIVLSFIFGSRINLYIGNYGEYLILILYNILVSILFIFLSKGIFEKIEME